MLKIVTDMIVLMNIIQSLDKDYARELKLGSCGVHWAHVAFIGIVNTMVPNLCQ